MIDWLIAAVWLLGIGVASICLYHVVRIAVRSALRDYYGESRSVEARVDRAPDGT